MKKQLPLLAILAMGVAMPAFAADPNAAPAGTGGMFQQHAPHGDRWQDAGQEKAHHAKFEERMKNATPEERAKMEERHAKMKERWENATPEQREKMKAHHEEMKKRWENATPEEREKMKARHEAMREKWKNATPEERAKMKAEHHEHGGKGGEHGAMKEKWENATPEERERLKAQQEELKQRWQTMSPEERASFRDRKAIEKGGQPQFRQPDLTPTPTDGGVTDIPNRYGRFGSK